MTYILEDKIRVGVSSCMYGAKVRWNRMGWDRVGELGREKDSFIWTPVCPEVASGMGVPRVPIRLVGGNGDDFWKGEARIYNRRGQDLSNDLREAMEESITQLKRAGVEAFVFMEGSPTCGVYRTTLKNTRLGKPPGAFGARLLQEDFFLIPAQDLQSPVKWWDWRRRLHAFVWVKRAEITTKQDLYQAWHTMKFLCQEVDRTAADRIGNELAAMPKRLTQQFVETWKSSVLQLLRQPSSLNKIYPMVQKQYAYYRNKLGKPAPKNLPPLDRIRKHAFIDELHELEKEAILNGVETILTPVVFHEKR